MMWDKLNRYADLVERAKVPVMLDPPPWLAQYAVDIAQVKGHALRWTRSLRWQLESLQEVQPRLDRLLKLLDSHQAHLLDFPLDELNRKKYTHLHHKLQQTVTSLLDLHEACQTGLLEFHAHLQHDRFVLERGAREGWVFFSEAIATSYQTETEVHELIQNVQQKIGKWKNLLERNDMI